VLPPFHTNVATEAILPRYSFIYPGQASSGNSSLQSQGSTSPNNTVLLPSTARVDLNRTIYGFRRALSASSDDSYSHVDDQERARRELHRQHELFVSQDHYNEQVTQILSPPSDD